MIIANVVSLGFAFFSRPLIARFLGPSEYGVFALVLGTAAVVPAFTLLSLNGGVLYFVSRCKGEEKKILGSGILLMSMFSLLFFIPSFFFVKVFVPSLSLLELVSVNVLAFSIALLILVQSFQQGLEKFKEYSVSTALSTALAAILSVLAGYFFLSAFASSLLRAVGMLLVCFWVLWKVRKGIAFDVKKAKELLKYSFPLAAAGFVATFITVTDRYVLAAYHSTADVGVYDIASSLTTAALPFIVVISNVMSPKVIKTPERIAGFFKAVSTANVVLLTAFGLGLYYLGEIAVTLLLGARYAAETPQLIRLLVISLPLIGIYSLSGVVMNSLNKTKVAAVLAASIVVVSLALNIMLVPSLATVGAAYANLGTYVLISVGCLTYLVAKFKVEYGHLVMQLALFVTFMLAYPFFAAGFVFKLIGLFAFGLLTVLLNRAFFVDLLSILSEKIAFRK